MVTVTVTDYYFPMSLSCILCSYNCTTSQKRHSLVQKGFFNQGYVIQQSHQRFSLLDKCALNKRSGVNNNTQAFYPSTRYKMRPVWHMVGMYAHTLCQQNCTVKIVHCAISQLKRYLCFPEATPRAINCRPFLGPAVNMHAYAQKRKT